MPYYNMQHYWYDTISNTLPNEVYKVFMFGHYRKMKNPALKLLLPYNSVLPFFSIAETTSLSSSGEDNNRKKRRTYLLQFLSPALCDFLNKNANKVDVSGNINSAFCDWTQHHKGKHPCCNALLNESYHTHNRLLTINSEQDLIWAERLQAQLHSGFVLGLFPYSGRYRIGWTAGFIFPTGDLTASPLDAIYKDLKKGHKGEWGMEQKYGICH